MARCMASAAAASDPDFTALAGNDRPVDGHPVHFRAPAPHQFVQLRRGLGIPVEDARHEAGVWNQSRRLAQADARPYACRTRHPAGRDDLARAVGGAADDQRMCRRQAFPTSFDVDDEIRQHEGEQRGHVCSLSLQTLWRKEKAKLRPAERGASLRPERGSDAPGRQRLTADADEKGTREREQVTRKSKGTRQKSRVRSTR